jgi:hypothetical protein
VLRTRWQKEHQKSMAKSYIMKTVTQPTALITNHESRITNQRNGKIARLPKATRDMINRMLDDSLSYHVIIDELGEAGEGLNTQNLTNWKQGGYQDYLKHQETIDRAKAQMEAATDFLRETGDLEASQINEACNKIAALQFFEVMWRHGDKFLKKAFAANPEKYITILNTVCSVANASIKMDAYGRFLKAAPTPSSQIKPDQAPNQK